MKVKLYTAPGCGYCLIIENFLKKNNVEYKKIDISKDEKEKEQLIKKVGKKTVPVTEIDEKTIVGFKMTEIKEVLGIK
jgi:NADH-dependent peroxiredoxin subunit F